MINAQPRIKPGKWEALIFLRFPSTNRLPHLGQTTRPLIINKKKKKKKKKRNYRIVDFDVSADLSVKLKESKNRDKYLELARERRALWNMKLTVVPIVIRAFVRVFKGLVHGTGRLGNKRVSTEHLNYSIIMIHQNTEKRLGHLRKFALTQTPVRWHQFPLVWKTLKRVKW